MVGLAQGLPESGKVGPAHPAVGEEGVVVDLSVDDHVESDALFGAVLPATNAGVGADIAIFLVVRAGDVQLVAVTVVHQMFTDAHTPAGRPFIGAGLGAGADEQAAEQQYLGYVQDGFSFHVVQILG